MDFYRYITNSFEEKLQFRGFRGKMHFRGSPNTEQIQFRDKMILCNV